VDTILVSNLTQDMRPAQEMHPVSEMRPDQDMRPVQEMRPAPAYDAYSSEHRIMSLAELGFVGTNGTNQSIIPVPQDQFQGPQGPHDQFQGPIKQEHLPFAQVGLCFN